MDGTYRFGFPLRVVEDDAERVVCYLREGTEVSASALAEGRDLRSVPLEERWTHPRITVRRAWQRTDVLFVFPRAQRWHSIRIMRQSGRLLGWYANLESPHVFGPGTISTKDGVLDLWVPADTELPEWKDEEEFGMAVQVGRISSEEARELRLEGERLMRECPWPTGWENWQPPDDWTRPRLPEDWDAPGA